MSNTQRKSVEPVFTRGDVAKILNVTPLTIANRERTKKDGSPGKYPEPKRDLNNYRIYSLNDVLNLQRLTYNAIDTRPIMSLLYDKGWRDMKQLGQIIDQALGQQKGER